MSNPNALIRAFTFADSTRSKNGLYLHNGRGHRVSGWEADPKKFLEAEVQPHLDAGYGTILLNRPAGTGRPLRTYPHTWDGQASTPTAPYFADGFSQVEMYALRELLNGSGVDQVFMYMGAPLPFNQVTGNPIAHYYAVAQYVIQWCNFLPNTVFIGDNDGSADATPLTMASAWYHALASLRDPPYDVPAGDFGLEPPPENAMTNEDGPAFDTNTTWGRLRPTWVAGSVQNWEAPTRVPLDDMHALGYKTLVLVRGDEFPKVEDRIRVAREWIPRVNTRGHVVLYGVTLPQFEEALKG